MMIINTQQATVVEAVIRTTWEMAVVVTLPFICRHSPSSEERMFQFHDIPKLIKFQ